MRIAVFGGDGFVGWPTCLHLSNAGHEITIVDNLSRRRIDTELGVQSLTPMDSIQERLRIWKNVSGRTMRFELLDIAEEYTRVKLWLDQYRPDALIHLAQQRAAPYSMKNDRSKTYTVNNNVAATHNLLSALVELELDTHFVHLGTMGVYGYSDVGATIPEGYLDVKIPADDGTDFQRQILYPTNPNSVYHLTKCLDQLMFAFYASNDLLRITDLHQGVVWGTHTDQTRRHEQLVNRFDYDGDYGTVLNRFLIQAAVKHPLTVHGTGGQTRAFIHIQDSVRCIELAVNNPPARKDRPKIFNQMTETFRIRDLAKLVSDMSGVEIVYLPNPRKEADENDLKVSNKQLLDLGLEPVTLRVGMLEELVEVAEKYAHRIDQSKIPAQSAWTHEIQSKISSVIDIATAKRKR
ncbi:MAG: NAD-dependent epimerase/dehydratase family protein [Gammaproteobacteria bacterium]|nr:NAD-dependent epimerase/dehydratase family protein [Gammaproteobacteria bacterium]MYC24907.1 NAD-dependent epimerase/dehydratase family protein [Gammaproteobacteria bacterium]